MDVDLDLPSSPPLCAQDWIPRKRALESEDNLSSDPIFSEDGSSETGESSNFRRKRVYKGPWWAHGKQAGHVREQLALADSGVWLPSEGSDVSLDSLPASSQAPTNTAIDQSFDRFSISTNQHKQAINATELAAKIVLVCVEREDDGIDLSDMALDVLHAHVIAPLSQMVITKAMDQQDSDSFAPLTPNLKLYLSTNELSEMPAELWDLTNITVLSLRNNKLRTLPAGVGRLRRLSELNVAGNEIQWLPWELFELIRGRPGEYMRLIAHPNPLWQPVDAATISNHDSVSFKDSEKLLADISILGEDDPNRANESTATLRKLIRRVAQSWLEHSQSSTGRLPPIYAASSGVRYYEVDGTPHRSYTRTRYHDTSTPWLADMSSNPTPPTTSRAPSLFELAARKMHQQLHLYSSTISEVVPESSEPVARALNLIQEIRSSDVPVCSVCSRSYLFKRAEWVEYWHCSTSAASVPSQLLFLPFMRQACSHGCVLRAWAERDDGVYE